MIRKLSKIFLVSCLIGFSSQLWATTVPQRCLNNITGNDCFIIKFPNEHLYIFDLAKNVLYFEGTQAQISLNGVPLNSKRSKVEKHKLEWSFNNRVLNLKASKGLFKIDFRNNMLLSLNGRKLGELFAYEYQNLE